MGFDKARKRWQGLAFEPLISRICLTGKVTFKAVVEAKP
jgi:hypothetical protein